VGTLSKYPFHSLLDRLLEMGLTGSSTTWQVPGTHRSLPGRVESELSSNEFDKQVLMADVVICHAGVGTLMRLWELGKYPIVIPRRHHRGEHVDDHQLQIASLVEHHGLGLVKDVGELKAEDLTRAASRAVVEVAGTQLTCPPHLSSPKGISRVAHEAALEP
jgi:UDP-N-acetylglucosamine transferase subunit ALG13